MGKMFMAASNYLPAQVSDMMNQDRAFATGRLSFSGQRNICTLSTYVRHHLLSTLLLLIYLHKLPKRMPRKKERREGGQEGE